MSLATLVRNAFYENIGLKAFSFAFALGMFAYIHSKEEVQQRTVPVSVITLTPPTGSLELMTQMPPNIHVTLHGSARAIDRVIKGGGLPPVEVDLRDGIRDVVTFDSDTFVQDLPPGVEVTIVDPPRIALEWQKVVTRDIPLQASITGQPAKGYVVKGEPKVEPSKISVKGPVGVVEVMQFARLGAFDVTGLTGGVFPRRIAIDPAPNRASYLEPQNATVTVTIARQTSEAKFDERPVEVIGVPMGVSNPRLVNVTVIGPPEIVRALRAEQVVPRANLRKLKDLDLKEMPHGSAMVKLEVQLDKAEVEIQPPSVSVRW